MSVFDTFLHRINKNSCNFLTDKPICIFMWQCNMWYKPKLTHAGGKSVGHTADKMQEFNLAWDKWLSLWKLSFLHLHYTEPEWLSGRDVQTRRGYGYRTQDFLPSLELVQRPLKVRLVWDKRNELIGRDPQWRVFQGRERRQVLSAVQAWRVFVRLLCVRLVLLHFSLYRHTVSHGQQTTLLRNVCFSQWSV